MAYLLDTNIISELQKGARATSSAQDWFAQASYGDLFLSVLIIGELQQGIARLRRRDAPQTSRLAEKLRTLESTFQDRILPITTPIAKRWAENNVPNPLPLVDGLLAATAQEHGLILVTRNTRDVAPSGVATLNPFEKVT
ncbi:type II toxin-antitoxin system VapC family toxin [Acidiferrobacter thiooxydans]|uniref:Ribonuclease VapC n=1 Tax=Acidiferrobacter thiooxydans TaxID=163359 RepID=A0A368HM17_9GAMM|nr:type II toxin-antitoxin system VapC family toxin [Acidiferrobacter thiooxydans]RCN59075.1 VapC toxin family PIN domain ribonuclease [Acidiferrobacter thiooxydans]